jgi:hypothetical protein
MNPLQSAVMLLMRSAEVVGAIRRGKRQISESREAGEGPGGVQINVRHDQAIEARIGGLSDESLRSHARDESNR